MFSRSLTSRILKEARSGGLPTDAGPGAAPDQTGGTPDYWGAQLASLVATGQVPEARLQALAWDAIGRDAGSWVDPLFKGPAPLGDLQGMGDRYRDLEILGEGATAQVFKALDTLLLRQVAIKVLKDPSAATLEEARAQAQVEHPNICRIYEVGNGFLVMQLVDGPTLARLAPSLTQTQKVQILRDVALGMHAAHQKGLIHLDLKLNNVLVESGEDGTFHPIVSDFGMVRGQAVATSDNCPMGTPPYSSPEQLAGDPGQLSRASDIYALGVMLYVLLSAAIPFEAQDFHALLYAIPKAPPIPLRKRVPGLPADLARIVHHCLEKRPEDRYASARELAEDLDRFLRSEPVLAMGKSRLYRLGKWVRRNRKVQWVGALGLILLVATAGVLVRHAAYVSQQGEWDHHFQQIVERLRGELDRIYRLPVHDIDPERQALRGTLGVIEAAMARGGKAAQGPGLLALGQAHRLLGGDDAQVVGYFQRAWDQGFRTESARSWLALAKVEQFQRAVRGASFGASSTEIRQHQRAMQRAFLEPAKALLQGRGGPDQAYLAHQVAKAGLVLREEGFSDRRIQLARAYRAQFPNDLDAMLEEAEALAEKADHSASWAHSRQEVYPPICAAEVEPLREASRSLLQQALRIAPSHPGVYAALAEGASRQDSLPTEQTPPTPVLLKQARVWLAQGRAISRTDPDLLPIHASFLERTALWYTLEQGQDPTPLAQELLGLVPDARQPGAERSRASLAFHLLAFSELCQRYGVPDVNLLVVAVDMITTPPVNGDMALSVAVPLAHAQVRRGEDPRPQLERVLQLTVREASEGDYRLLAEFLLADYDLLTGGDPRVRLRRLEAALPRVQSTGVRAWLALRLRLLRARVSGQAGDWLAFQEELQRLEDSPTGKGFAFAEVVEGHLALVRHRLEVGEDARPSLETLRRLEATTTARKWTSLFFQRLARATRCLVQGRLDRDTALLLEGLALCEAMGSREASLKPGEINAGGRRPLSSDGLDLRERDRIRVLQGELALALAHLEGQPARRAVWAREAIARFDEALKLNRNLEHSVRPLRAQALGLAALPEGPHARP